MIITVVQMHTYGHALSVANYRGCTQVHVLGDVHVYANHVSPLQEQLKNSPRPFPVHLPRYPRTAVVY